METRGGGAATTASRRLLCLLLLWLGPLLRRAARAVRRALMTEDWGGLDGNARRGGSDARKPATVVSPAPMARSPAPTCSASSSARPDDRGLGRARWKRASGGQRRPQAGDCCVSCSYGSVPCSDVQREQFGAP